MVSVVVCDDDRVTRGAVTALCEDLGLHVVAETDQWTAALELVRRFDVDILVLDLMLTDGSAEHTLMGLRDDGDGPAVVMFSSYASDPGRLLNLGAREVAEKPDFEALGAVLERIASGVEHGTERDERTNRRFGSRDTDSLPDLWRSPSGIATTADLDASLVHLVDGDAVLVVALTALDLRAVRAGEMLVVDCHLALGRLLASTLRAQDIVHEAPDAGGFVALLRGGDERAAPATLRRLVGLMSASHLPGVPVATFARVDAMGGADAVARAVGALRSGGGSISAIISDAILDT